MPGAIIFPSGRPAPAPKKVPSHEGDGNSFGVVYVNGLAREAMIGDPPIGDRGRLARNTVPFPRGSILVREKLPQADAKDPELLTVMIKRAAGFNPKAGDWEFLMINGAGTKVLERQKKGSCLDCHKSQATTDFVYPSSPAP